MLIKYFISHDFAEKVYLFIGFLNKQNLLIFIYQHKSINYFFTLLTTFFISPFCKENDCYKMYTIVIAKFGVL